MKLFLRSLFLLFGWLSGAVAVLVLIVEAFDPPGQGAIVGALVFLAVPATCFGMAWALRGPRGAAGA